MRIAILNPAPDGEKDTRWGDYYFGIYLQRALIEEGADVVEQAFWPDWETLRGFDVTLILRGRRTARRRVDSSLVVMWNISHPATLSRSELDSVDCVLATSEVHRLRLRELGVEHVYIAPQCFEPKIFSHHDSTRDALRSGILFVANSRGVFRQMAQFSYASGIDVDIIGRGWRKFPVSHLVRMDFIENHELGNLYRKYQIGLVDHWNDMNYFGIASNRVVEYAASALPFISDNNRDVSQSFGAASIVVESSRDFSNAVKRIQENYDDYQARATELSLRIRESMSFSRCAQIILRAVNDLSNTRSKLYRKQEDGTEQNGAPARGRLLPRTGGKLYEYCLSLQTAQKRGTTPLRWLVLRDIEDTDVPECNPDSVLTAGLSVGPYEVLLDDHLRTLQDRAFDIIVACVEFVLRLSCPVEAALFAIDKLRRHGRIIVCRDSEASLFVAALREISGMTEWEPAPGVLEFRKT